VGRTARGAADVANGGDRIRAWMPRPSSDIGAADAPHSVGGRFEDGRNGVLRPFATRLGRDVPGAARGAAA